MFAFKLWSHFGVFRDPITITQNVTFSIPPKTTIGGMLAAILGIDYNDYFENPQYFDFQYSLVLKNPIRKQSFSQNYVEDYTKKSHLKHGSMKKVIQSSINFEKIKNENVVQSSLSDYDKIENEVVLEAKNKHQKELTEFWDRIRVKMPKPKPIRRELLMNPSYVIFIKDYMFEDEIIEFLKSHNTGFSLFMGNSEFSANYKFLNCENSVEKKLSQVNSFTQFQDDIKFESGRKYTTVYAATKTVKGRKYRDFKRITICDKEISFNKPVDGLIIKTEDGEYSCEFI